MHRLILTEQKPTPRWLDGTSFNTPVMNRP